MFDLWRRGAIMAVENFKPFSGSYEVQMSAQDAIKALEDWHVSPYSNAEKQDLLNRVQYIIDHIELFRLKRGVNTRFMDM